MTKMVLLEVLKELTRDAVKDLLLPVRRQEEDAEEPEPRVAKVYKMRLPDSASYRKKAPYIIIQAVNSRDTQHSGGRPESVCGARFIFCVYSKDEQEGGMYLLNLMERVRIRLLEDVLIGDGQFDLDLESGVEAMTYDDDTAPYYAGEMMTVWKMPAVERKIKWQ